MTIEQKLMHFFELQSILIFLKFSDDVFEILSLEYSEWLLIWPSKHCATTETFLESFRSGRHTNWIQYLAFQIGYVHNNTFYQGQLKQPWVQELREMCLALLQFVTSRRSECHIMVRTCFHGNQTADKFWSRIHWPKGVLWGHESCISMVATPNAEYKAAYLARCLYCCC
jgi:hypothetical protein